MRPVTELEPELRGVERTAGGLLTEFGRFVRTPELGRDVFPEFGRVGRTAGFCRDEFLDSGRIERTPLLTLGRVDCTREFGLLVLPTLGLVLRTPLLGLTVPPLRELGVR